MRQLSTSLVLAVLAALPIAAQQPAAAGFVRSNTSKLFVEVAANGSGIFVYDLSDGTETGGGLTLRLGYGFTPKIAAFIDFAGSTITADGGNYELAHGDLGLRYHFANSAKAWVPFLEVAGSVFVAWQEDITLEDDQGNVERGDLEISGVGVTLGGGLLYFFNPKWALSTGIKWTTGEFDDVKFGNVSFSGLKLDATTTRLNVGVAWFPMRSR